MIDVREYIKLILKKKKYSLTEFTKKINEVEKIIDKNEITRVQNISNYLNGYHDIRPKMLVIWELALDVKEDSLTCLVKEPLSKNGKKEFEKIKKEIRGKYYGNISNK